MTLLLLINLIFSSVIQSAGTTYVCRDVRTSLYSEAPLENIEAASVAGFSVLNSATGEVQFNIPIKSFKFKKSLMQEHFNENYMESDKYPYARFKGKINQPINMQASGDYAVTVTGELDIHGVKKQRTINGTLKVAGNAISISSKINVLCKDHNIEIPQLVFKNIAENIQVTVAASYTNYTPIKL